MMVWRRSIQWRELDGWLVMSCLGLTAVGLAAIYSATYGRLTSVPRMQSVWVAVSVLGCAVTYTVGYRRLLSWSYVLYALCVVALLVVLWWGPRRLGAERWLLIGPVSVQPSEFAKLLVLLVLARYLHDHDPQRAGWGTLLMTMLLVAGPLVLILQQPDLGTALIFVPVWVAALWVWGAPGRWFGAMVTAAVLAAPLAWQGLKEYQRQRLLVFVDPDADPLGAGYTMIQSRIAIGSGGWYGKGWLGGTQNLLNFLPERHTDFVFSVIGEEWGMLGTLVVVALFAVLCWRMCRVAMISRDPSGRLVAVNIVTLIVCQALINLGMSMGFMPVVGLPLPFVSYGGSSLLTCFICLGVVLSIRRDALQRNAL